MPKTAADLDKELEEIKASASDDFRAGFAASRHQAANLVGHLIYDEILIQDDADRMEDLASKCADAVRSMEDNGTRPEQGIKNGR